MSSTRVCCKAANIYFKRMITEMSIQTDNEVCVYSPVCVCATVLSCDVWTFGCSDGFTVCMSYLQH